jgi:hypothetical protein
MLALTQLSQRTTQEAVAAQAVQFGTYLGPEAQWNT